MKAIASLGVRSLCSMLLEEYVTHHYGNAGCQSFKGGIFPSDPSLQQQGNFKDSKGFCHIRLTLRINTLTLRHLVYSQNTIIFFEYVDFGQNSEKFSIPHKKTLQPILPYLP